MPLSKIRIRRFTATLVLLLVSGSALHADDWPQWMGPRRDNTWREDGIIERFPEGGPKVVWRAPIKGGYAGPAVEGGRVWILDYATQSEKDPNFKRQEKPGTERIVCLDAATGDEIWNHEYPVTYSISYPAGPRCTPTVHEGKVYALGAHGRLTCIDAKTRKILWWKELTREYKTKPALWGYTNHPLVDGKKLICIVGGEGSHAVAFDKDTGKEIWRTITAKEQGYCPPVIYKAGGVRQLVLLRSDGVSGVNPETGDVYWTIPYEATSGSIIMTPILSGEYLYMGGYSNKNLLVGLAKDKPAATEVWRDLKKKALSAVNVQPFLEGNVFYGFDQRGSMHAVEIPSGERLWDSTGPIDGGRPQQVATAFIVKEKTATRDRFWLFNERGELIIANLSRDGYEELDRTKVIEPTGAASGRSVVWSAPAFANRRAYIRNDEECVCVELAAR